MVLSKQKNILSIFFTILSLVSFSVSASQLETNEPVLKKTRMKVLRCVERKLGELKLANTQFMGYKGQFMEAANGILPEGHRMQGRLFSNSYLRKKVLVSEFKAKREAYELGLTQKVISADLDKDLQLKVEATLTSYAAEIGYEKVCSEYRKAHMNHLLFLMPVMEAQSKNFERYSALLSSVVSEETFLSDKAYEKLQGRLMVDMRLKDLTKFQSLLSSAKRDVSFTRKLLNDKLNDLLIEAKRIQAARNQRGVLGKFFGRSGQALKSFYWNRKANKFAIPPVA